jgi:hypothetical protein
MRNKPARSLWTVSFNNQKTGAVPTQYVGATRKETWDSCSGCNLRPDADGGCYAWAGKISRGANSVRKAAARGKDYSLEACLERTPRSAKVIRFGAIGDPARVNRAALLQDIDTAREAGLKVIGYTHHWKEEPITGVLRNTFLASCETVEQADEAMKRGWLVSVAGPDSLPGMVTCPNYKREEIQCNRCGLCEIATLRRSKFKGVVFPAHGGSKKRLPLATG